MTNEKEDLSPALKGFLSLLLLIFVMFILPALLAVSGRFTDWIVEWMG